MERSHGGIGILVKTPGHSPIKTRLAREVGQERAESFHRLACQSILKRIREVTQPAFSPYWAVAERSAVESPEWKTLPVLAQGDGTFGQRLARTYTQLLERHPFAILLAPDSPHLPRNHLVRAGLTLKHSGSFVVGPARDGGFYLMGGSIPLPTEFWEEIPYSSPLTEKQLTRRLLDYGGVERLPELTDVDEPEDIHTLQREWAHPDPPLAQWLGEFT